MVGTFAPLELTDGEQDIAIALDFACRRRDSPPSLVNAVWIHDWRTGNGPPALSLARTEEGFLLRFPDLADFSIREKGNWIDAWAAPGAHDETLRHLLLDQVLPRLLAHRGQLVLHAGGIAVDDIAIAFLGETGSGKSTLTASFLAAGHLALSDDGLVLKPIEGAVTAVPTYPSLRLWPESLAGLYAEPPALAPMAHYTTKQRVILSEDETVSQTLPLAALFVLAPTTEAGDSTIGLTRLSPRDTCMAMIENSFQLDVTDSHRVASLLAEAAKVATKVPAFRLTYPRNFELLPSVRAAILEQRELLADTGMRSHSG